MRGKPVQLDKNGKVVPLKGDSIVKLKRVFRDGLVSYSPARFGTRVPKGAVLPKDALILGPAVPEVKEHPQLAKHPELDLDPPPEGEGEGEGEGKKSTKGSLEL